MVKYYIWVFSNHVWIFCSTSSTNVPFCLFQIKYWHFVHRQMQYSADFKQSFNISLIHQIHQMFHLTFLKSNFKNSVHQNGQMQYLAVLKPSLDILFNKLVKCYIWLSCRAESWQIQQSAQI